MVGRILFCPFAFALVGLSQPPNLRGDWVGTWACSPQLVEPANRPPAPGLAGSTLREIVHVSIGGNRIRVRLTNQFGDAAVSIGSVHVAQSADRGAIARGTDRALTFGGGSAVTIAPGAAVTSDALDFSLAPISDMAITLQFASVPPAITGHPGSRETSFLARGDFVSASVLPNPVKVDHWYFISGLDVLAADPAAGAIVALGDSITDGHGTTTNGNDRWPDQLARRLQANGAIPPVAVLNQGIGGNRLLRDGLGPNAVSRFNRDVLAQPGVRWLIVFEGINDLGTAVGARARRQPAATPRDIIAAYRLFIDRAHARGIRVYGATITAFAGFSLYDSPASEADRQEINRWIRTGGKFDAVIDFDAATRDPQQPLRLAAEYDLGDHLHLNPAGYEWMAQAIDLKLFRP